ncbi:MULTISPECIES: bifunctional folylpolyglutamate synthase/dihydrofolate synthase [Actinotignum]|uniref:tetrahydrofolate synthase n=1 Tax=Actinotignum timonense TaxID=1870995 RepID=A0ABU5GAL0_9ACTO|nr:folylpolyglutamate synthase/dihydrofolate synthase family protein [Actinotignum timonense]MDK6372633.1 folylpolyglutamate synthase/dihydrofolate synthase family protein [Actinotignum timonense]MDK6418363.1 folylpolyglutamate synthase/dihydrofolate synthase family protein [Actinotignum timonense]MDK6589663.1 folylpolyglutamate synthase/dihydrofolate synthase family protein [Actinotignum timonense]MDK6645586.1 folylpolyglutamate synthase/dihydrofolate synthase family protein [Actinotignum timo
MGTNNAKHDGTGHNGMGYDDAQNYREGELEQAGDFGPEETSEAPDAGEPRDPEGARDLEEPRDPEESREAELDAALTEVLSSGLFGDEAVIREVKQSPNPIIELADTTAEEARVEAIYRDILTRAPEHKVQPSLERVQMCLDLLGNPHHSYRCVHVTGTNGKTSTARMIEALLREHGLRTGRFTSPHLVSVRERIAIDGHNISRADFIQAWEDVAPFVELVDQRSQAEGGPRMSFFEVFVVMAYVAFAAAPIDVAVVEVGMGGRWDATNVIDGDVAVLTPIALDHERWLGHTIAQIAGEKVGIIKPGASVVSAAQPEDAAVAIAQAAHQARAHVSVYGEDIEVLGRETAVGGQLMTVRTPAARYDDIPLALRGSYQAENAALALTAVEAFFGGRALSGDVVEHALMAVTSPGRLEVVRTSPTVLVDAAHNPHGAAHTAAALEEYYPGRRVGVLAMMADKDVEGTLGQFEPVLDAVVVTDMPGERAMDAEELAELAREVFGEDRVRVERDLLAAIDEAAGWAEAEAGEELATPVVAVLGSVYLAGMARQIMGKGTPDEAPTE